MTPGRGLHPELQEARHGGIEPEDVDVVRIIDPVGLFEDAQYEAGYIKFKPGDRFVIVTDGVTEAENEAGDFFSYEQLLAIAGQSAGLNDLFDCVTKFCAGVPLRDDCTVLELCYGRPA